MKRRPWHRRRAIRLPRRLRLEPELRLPCPSLRLRREVVRHQLPREELRLHRQPVRHKREVVPRLLPLEGGRQPLPAQGLPQRQSRLSQGLRLRPESIPRRPLLEERVLYLKPILVPGLLPALNQRRLGLPSPRIPTRDDSRWDGVALLFCVAPLGRRSDDYLA